MKKKSPVKKILLALGIIILLLVLIIVPAKVLPVLSDSLSVSAHTDSAPLMVAHRGFSSIHPQNTHLAFDGAVKAGFDGYEFDIHTTKDGQWVVIHDDTVDAMTDGTGKVEDFTLEEIKKLNIDSGNGIENSEILSRRLTVPTLEEALSYAEENEIIPVIEIKKCDITLLPTLKEYLDEKGLSQKAVIISFNKEYMEEYRRLDPQAQMLYLVHCPTKEDVDWCAENNFGVNYHFMNLYKCVSAIKYAKEKGLQIGAWTVDNTVYKDVMVLFGADIITTNKIKP